MTFDLLNPILFDFYSRFFICLVDKLFINFEREIINEFTVVNAI